MVINEINFPIYAFIILIAIIFGVIFNYIYLKKTNVDQKLILLYLLQYIVFSIVGGLIFKNSFKKIIVISLSSYGGAIGAITSAIVFERMYPKDNIFIKGTILSLPLVYSISKIGCFLAGCCFGIPYDGVFSVTYTNGLNIPQMPIQLMETIVFMILFVICLFFRKKENNMCISKVFIRFFKVWPFEKNHNNKSNN